MTDLSLSEFALQLFQKHGLQADDRHPFDGTLELTRLCSLKCTHCYIGDARWLKDANEMSTENIKTVLDVLARQGTLLLTLTGGEAMVRRDFREIWLYARAQGFLITLFTNATLISEEMAQFLAEHPPVKIDVSIYGASEEIYEQVTQIPGSHRRFLQGVALLQKYALPWRLKTVVLKENLSEIDAMRALASVWHVDFSMDEAIHASAGEGRSGGRAPCASRPPLDQVVKTQMANKIYRGECERNQTQYREMKPDNALFTCGAGKNSFYITSRGHLQMCVATAHRGHDLFSKGTVEAQFSQAWSAFARARSAQLPAHAPCFDCDLRAICKSCPGYAFLENHNEQSAVEWLCRLTHLKAKALKLPHNCQANHYYQCDSDESK